MKGEEERKTLWLAENECPAARKGRKKESREGKQIKTILYI